MSEHTEYGPWSHEPPPEIPDPEDQPPPPPKPPEPSALDHSNAFKIATMWTEHIANMDRTMDAYALSCAYLDLRGKVMALHDAQAALDGELVDDNRQARRVALARARKALYNALWTDL
jgi:hypothetical protein